MSAPQTLHQPEADTPPVPTSAHAEPNSVQNRLSRSQIIHIFSIKAANPKATQAEIAAAVGCERSTVSRWLSDHKDTTEEAANVLNAGALRASLRVTELVESDQEKVALDASKTVLRAAKVLDQDSSGLKVGIQVMIGVSGPIPSQVIDSAGVVVGNV